MKFSVIIPVYNVAAYLRECLDSIEVAVARFAASSKGKNSPLLPKVEIIAVDDGSTDGCDAILEAWAGGISVDILGNGHTLKAKHSEGIFPFVSRRIIHQSNAGVCAARNAALDIVSGEWILFVDADDVVHPQVLEIYSMVVAEHSNADLIRGDMRYFNDGKWHCDEIVKRPSCIEFDVSWKIPPAIFYGFFWGGVYRSNIHGKHRFGLPVKLKIGEDNLYFAQACELSQCAVKIDVALHGYRQRVDSAYHSERNAVFWQNDFAHYYQVLKIFNEGMKHFAPSIVREYSMRTTEGYSDYLPPLTAEDYGDKWQILLDFYGKVRHFTVLPPWFRFVINVCALTRSPFLYFVLCRIPRLIKLKGFHR